MPHVELSLTGDRRRPRTPDPVRSLDRWAAATVDASEPCLVLRADAVIIALSGTAAELFGFGNPNLASGRQLQDAVAHLMDFNDSPGQLDRSEADKIPPLLAISSGRLARGLIRIACPDSGTINTMDAVASPLWEAGTVVGSITFFSRI